MTRHSMRKFLLCLLCLGSWVAIASARSEKPNTVILHPGDVVYARFERKGRNLTLISATKEANDQAQIILRFGKWDRSTHEIGLVVENKFDRELTYRIDARVPSIGMHREPPVIPVVEGKISQESWPLPLEELAAFGFELSK